MSDAQRLFCGLAAAQPEHDLSHAVRHGDTIALWGMITEKNEEDGVPTVYCDLVVENEHGERAITGTAVLVPYALQR